MKKICLIVMKIVKKKKTGNFQGKTWKCNLWNSVYKATMIKM